MNYGPVEFVIDFNKEMNSREARVANGPYYEEDLSKAVNWLEDECELRVVM
jgi:hypothetical protein